MPLCDRCAAAEVAVAVAVQAVIADAKAEALCRACAGKALAEVDVNWEERIKVLTHDSLMIDDQIEGLKNRQAVIALEIAKLQGTGKVFPAPSATAKP